MNDVMNKSEHVKAMNSLHSDENENVESLRALVKWHTECRDENLKALRMCILAGLGLKVGDVVRMGDIEGKVNGVVKAETTTPGIEIWDKDYNLRILWNLDRVVKVEKEEVGVR